MNITELARQVKIPTKQLRELMPVLGFDIGARAIKVDSRIAQEVIRKLSNKSKRDQLLQSLEQPTETVEEVKETPVDSRLVAENEIQLPAQVVVKDFAKMIHVDVTKLVVELMRQGVMASLNDRVDFETASIVAEDFGFKAVKTSEGSDSYDETQDVKKFIENGATENTQPRPPVVVVMGHVDHGKTTLLDAIRETDVVSQESGGITQHIGAYQVAVPEASGKKEMFSIPLLTFIDTPGHEAFSLMRSRGARIADLAILVVAADDAVQPQTIEALSHIRTAELPFVVAINKIDKENANVDKVKKELAELGVTPEDWGGDTMMVQISAKQKTNISDVLESLLLLAEINKESIVADPSGVVLGTVIESHVDKGAGPVSTILVRNGTLKIGQSVVVGGVPGKIRSMKNWQQHVVDSAQPSMPVVILGLKQAPRVGDMLKGTEDWQEMKKTTRQFKKRASATAMRNAVVTNNESEQNTPRLNVIIKSDVLGSLEAIHESLEKLDRKDIIVDIISEGVGYITESDIVRAEDVGAHVLGFNAYATSEAEELARSKGVTVKSFEIIYDLLNFVAEEASKKLSPEITRTELGRLKVLQVFRREKDYTIAGGKVVRGSIVNESKVEVMRNNALRGKGSISELQSGKEPVTEVVEDQEAGLKLIGVSDIEPGDELVVFQEESKQRTVSF